MFVDNNSNLKIYWGALLFVPGWAILALQGLIRENGVREGITVWAFFVFIFLILFILFRLLAKHRKKLYVAIVSIIAAISFSMYYEKLINKLFKLF